MKCLSDYSVVDKRRYKMMPESSQTSFSYGSCTRSSIKRTLPVRSSERLLTTLASDRGRRKVQIATVEAACSEFSLCPALCELTGSKTSQSQRTAGTVGRAAAENLGWLRQTAEFAKGASCAVRPPQVALAAPAANVRKVRPLPPALPHSAYQRPNR